MGELPLRIAESETMIKLALMTEDRAIRPMAGFNDLYGARPGKLEAAFKNIDAGMSMAYEAF
jgi:hypothetical protein